MKEHPKREELVKVACSEGEPKVQAHLDSCGECSRTVDEWRATLNRLDAWKVPTRPKAVQWIKYAAAACVLLGIGFGIGQLTRSDGLQKEEVASLIAAEKSHIYKDFVLALEQTRSEEREFTSLLLGELREDQSYKLVQLRKDLETVASRTDAGLRETQMGIIQLSAYKQE